MSRRPARFTQADVRRAVKATEGKMAVDIMPDGRIRLAPITADGLTPGNDDDELDRELREHRARREGRA